MSYRRCETALANALSTISGLENSVAQGHHGAIFSRDFSVVLTPSTVSREPSGLQSVRIRWGVNAQLYYRTSDTTVDDDYDKILDLADSVADVVDIYPTLGAPSVSNPRPGVTLEQIISARLVSAGTPTTRQIQRLFLWTQQLTFSIQERIVTTPNFAELSAAIEPTENVFGLRLPRDVRLHVGDDEPLAPRPGDWWFESLEDETE